MKKFALAIAFFGFILISCEKTEKLNAQQIIDKSIEVSGGKMIDSSVISFKFRDKFYKASRNKGKFEYVRLINDSLGNTIDILNNSGFKRYANNELSKLPDSMLSRYSNSVNSVNYFSVLPYGLNDDAVIKNYLGETTIKDKQYHKIKVTFNEKNGGDDFDDVFVYWINSEDYKLEYLAYEFHVNDGGMRFREAYNERIINGIRFVDYNNYKPKTKDVSILKLDSLFEVNDLKLLSKIELENIIVN